MSVTEEKKEKTREKFAGKKVLIWGYGREGRSTEKFLKEQCRNVDITIFEGKRQDVHEELYDLVMISPGIPFEETNPKFTSQTQVFLETFGDRTVGITGTKGKSTTSALLYTVLDACSGKKAFLLGNIGRPCLDYFADMEDNSVAVFELSCHQCQHLTADPHIAVFLDLYADHLDRYHTLEHYFEAKTGITRSQSAEDYLYKGKQVPPLLTRAQVTEIGYEDVGQYQLRLHGRHNQFNAEFVYRIATEHFGCDPQKVREAMAGFGGLPHRLEFFATVDGVDYYDDSISTIPEAAMDAMDSVENAKIALIGGMDRGIDYTALIDYMKSHPQYQFILGYASGERIAREMKERCGVLENVTLAADLDEMTACARRMAPRGSAVILSPAAASYGYFKNFEVRGDYFKSLVTGKAQG